MLLISFYGPVISAVGSLSTLIVAALVDWLVGKPIAFPTLIGSAFIIGSFVSLLARQDPEGVQHRTMDIEMA